jgi:hypothetical protein
VPLVVLVEYTVTIGHFTSDLGPEHYCVLVKAGQEPHIAQGGQCTLYAYSEQVWPLSLALELVLLELSLPYNWP